MPFIDPEPDSAVLPRTSEGVTPPIATDPSTFSTVGAAFRQDNPLLNLYQRLHEETYPEVPDYNPLDDIRGSDYDAFHRDAFIASRSPAETSSIKRKIDTENNDRRTLEGSGFAGTVAQIVAGTLDPTLFLPAGVAVKSIEGGYSVARTAALMSAAAAAQSGVQEGILQGAQATRTAGETVGAVASSAIIGGILGSGAAALLSRTERAALERLVDADRLAMDAHATGQAAPAGAAARDERQLELLRTPFDRAGLDNLSVTRRTLGADAVEARRVIADLAETPYRFSENDAGVAATQGPALDRVARMEMNGTRVKIADELDRAFSEYRFGEPDKSMPRLRSRIADFTGKSEGKMSFSDFKEEVSTALQNGDQHAIPQVAEAAQFIRRNLFEPWTARAENAIEGFQRIEPKEGESYFPHSWNKEKIRAQRPEFTNKLTDLYAADQATKREIQRRLDWSSAELGKMQDKIGKLEAKLTEAGGKGDALLEELQTATKAHDELRAKIENDIAAWHGSSVQDAKAALKAREKYATETARKPDEPRLKSADAAVDRAVKRILNSDREMPVEDLRARAHQTVDRILGSPDGRLPYDLAAGGPRIGHQREPMPRGALASRQLDVSNAWAKDWIENDVEHAISMHLRTMIPDVLMAERFGDVEMSPAMRSIEDAYSRLIDTTKSEKEATRLGKERDAVIRDVAAVRDRVRGVYGWSPELANMARVANAAKSLNNLSSMGVSALSSLPDFAGTIFRWGLGGALKDGWAPFLRGMTSKGEEWGKFKSQMRAIGIGVETAINARQHALDDITDVYRPQSRVERTLQYASDKFFIANMLAPLTDVQKLIASHAAVSEILRATQAVTEGKATKRQIGNLAESGIDANMAGRIWQEFGVAGKGERTNGVYLPNTKDWTDKAAADALNGAVSRETDIAVVTPGQEKPLWMSKPVVSLLGQFKAFTAAATERILVANMQRRDAAALQGAIFSIGLGMLSYKLNSLVGGQPMSERPQDWVKEGISRGGLLGWLEDGNALASKGTRGSVDIYRLIGADKPLSRFASRSAADMLLGPTWGKIESLPKITGAISSGEWNYGDTAQVRRLLPLQNLFYLRGLLNKVEDAANHAAGVEPRPQQ